MVLNTHFGNKLPGLSNKLSHLKIAIGTGFNELIHVMHIWPSPTKNKF